MIKNIALLVLVLISSLATVAQENDLENQFNNVIKKSNSYQEYKVIKKVEIYTLKNNVLDSVSLLEQQIETSLSEIEQQKRIILNLNTELEKTKNELITSKKKEEGIQLFGMLTNKATYKALAFSIIGFLIFAIVVLYLKFKKSYTVTKYTKEKLSETEDELELFRQKTLEREQKLRRKLQDEINKNKDA